MTELTATWLSWVLQVVGCFSQARSRSLAVKHIALAEYMKGTKLIFIDPESEYKDLCLNLNGDWINAGGDKRGLLNPLQIRPAPKDTDEEKSSKINADGDTPLYVDEGYGMSDFG